jgi:hypothetical protein
MYICVMYIVFIINGDMCNFFRYNFTTPALVNKVGQLFFQGNTFVVDKLMFPTTDTTAYVAFQSSLATQSVQLLMTGYVLFDNRSDSGEIFASYQPSILTVDVAKNKAVGSSGYMLLTSPVDVPANSPPGFQLTFTISRNTITVVRYYWFSVRALEFRLVFAAAYLFYTHCVYILIASCVVSAHCPLRPSSMWSC